MSNQLHHRRCFLNEKEGAAMLEATITDYSGTNREGEKHYNIDGTLHITDCSRSIELSFSVTDVDSARDALRKLDRLIDEIGAMRDAVVRVAKKQWPGRKF